MGEKAEKALGLHKNGGFNCAASVLGAFCLQYGLDETTAVALAGGFGAGMRSGLVCGAASGGVMVIGLKHGQRLPGDAETKKACYQYTQAFMQDFKRQYGALCCPQLLGCDITTPEGMEQMEAQGLKQKVCDRLIAGVAETLEQQGY